MKRVVVGVFVAVSLAYAVSAGYVGYKLLKQFKANMDLIENANRNEPYAN